MVQDDAIVLDIVNAARLIQSFIQDMTKEAFGRPQDSVCRVAPDHRNR